MSAENTVLIVEDDKTLRETLTDYLSQNDFDVLTATDGEEAIKVFAANQEVISIVLLDGMLPKMDGLDVLKRIRQTRSTPVIMISARETEDDQVQGFRSGADGYFTKPFLMSVLKEQMLALLSRTNNSPKYIIRGALKIDTGLHRVYIDNQDVTTTPKEYDVLMLFLENEKIVLNRDTILDRVWGIDYFGDFRTVDTIIKQLRRKLTDKHNYIKSVYGVGYYFEVEDA